MSKQLENQKQAINFFINYKGAVLETIDNVNILRYDINRNGETKPTVAFFIGKSAKATDNYFYPSEDKREAAISKLLVRELAHAEWKKSRSEERKAFIPTAKKGDIFVSSWGYEQTQVDFYLLQKMKGKTGTFVKIGAETVKGSNCTSGLADNVMPLKDIVLGEPFKKLILAVGKTEHIRLKSYEYCHKWNGSPMYRSWGY